MVKCYDFLREKTVSNLDSLKMEYVFGIYRASV